MTSIGLVGSDAVAMYPSLYSVPEYGAAHLTYASLRIALSLDPMDADGRAMLDATSFRMLSNRTYPTQHPSFALLNAPWKNSIMAL